MARATSFEPLPIYIIAGVLGSGKTTLMARLAQYCIARKHRVGMIANDIGDLGVDAILLAETGWPHAAVDSLNGDCACCSDTTDLEDVLLGMRELRRELLLFETTGVADAADMLSQTTAHHLRRLIQTPRLISVIDVTRYPDPQHTDPLVQRQVALADAIVLAKTDLVEAARVAAAIAIVQEANPGVPLFRQGLADDEVESLLEATVRHGSTLVELLVDGPPGHPLPHTLTLDLRRRLSRDRFDALLRTLPPTVLRAKGFVTLDVEPSLHTFQYVEGGFVQLTPFARRPGMISAAVPVAAYGVFIGTQLDRGWLTAQIESCLAR